MSQAESVVYWTEYVLRHKGAPHLKSQALNLRWYQYYLLDVLAVLLVIIFVVIFTTREMCKSIYMYGIIFCQNYKPKPE